MMNENMKPGLTLQSMRISRSGTPLVTIDQHIAPGETLTIMGPSGSGKSTLINALSGFLPKVFTCLGRALLDGVDITDLPPEKRRVGVLFQDPLLFPHFSVLQNITLALPRGGSRSARKEQALDLLSAVNLADCADQDPATLSGGQQARVALMRVMAAQPKALLLDEPFSKLDAQLRDSVRELVFAEVRSRNLPALLVTHDQADAAASGGKILAL